MIIVKRYYWTPRAKPFQLLMKTASNKRRLNHLMQDGALAKIQFESGRATIRQTLV
jgi:hypothetical protein